MDPVPSIEGLFDDGAYQKIRGLLERDDYGFWIDSSSFRRLKRKPSEDQIEIRKHLEEALKRIAIASAGRYWTRMCCDEFEYSRDELIRVFSIALWMMDLFDDPKRQIRLEPGLKYRCLRELGDYKIGEEISVIYAGQYWAEQSTSLELIFSVTCLPRPLEIHGAAAIDDVARSFSSYFQHSGEFDVEKARKERRGDRT